MQIFVSEVAWMLPEITTKIQQQISETKQKAPSWKQGRQKAYNPASPGIIGKLISINHNISQNPQYNSQADGNYN